MAKTNLLITLLRNRIKKKNASMVMLLTPIISFVPNLIMICLVVSADWADLRLKIRHSTY